MLQRVGGCVELSEKRLAFPEGRMFQFLALCRPGGVLVVMK